MSGPLDSIFGGTWTPTDPNYNPDFPTVATGPQSYRGLPLVTPTISLFASGVPMSSPLFLDSNGNPISTAICGVTPYTFAVPGYSKVWLSQTLNGKMSYDGVYSVPMPSFVADCVSEVGVYQNAVYTVAQGGGKGSYIGSVPMTILPNSNPSLPANVATLNQAEGSLCVGSPGNFAGQIQNGVCVPLSQKTTSIIAAASAPSIPSGLPGSLPGGAGGNPSTPVDPFKPSGPITPDIPPTIMGLTTTELILIGLGLWFLSGR